MMPACRKTETKWDSKNISFIFSCKATQKGEKHNARSIRKFTTATLVRSEIDVN